jgi:hypothetical protein
MSRLMSRIPHNQTKSRGFKKRSRLTVPADFMFVYKNSDKRSPPLAFGARRGRGCHWRCRKQKRHPQLILGACKAEGNPLPSRAWSEEGGWRHGTVKDNRNPTFVSLLGRGGRQLEEEYPFPRPRASGSSICFSSSCPQPSLEVISLRLWSNPVAATPSSHSLSTSTLPLPKHETEGVASRSREVRPVKSRLGRKVGEGQQWASY